MASIAFVARRLTMLTTLAKHVGFLENKPSRELESTTWNINADNRTSNIHLDAVISSNYMFKGC